jgi:hypothetical protein
MKPTDAQILDALYKIRERFTKSPDYLCRIASQLSHESEITYRTAKFLEVWFCGQLGKSISLESWLLAKGVVHEMWFCSGQYNYLVRKTRETRLAWLNSMIGLYK